MLWGNTDGNLANKNAKSGDSNSLETLQEQNVEMISDFSEWEIESESNDSDWEKASAASANVSQNISATPNSMIAANDFTLMANKTMDIGDHCKPWETLCAKICYVLQGKGDNIQNTRFNGIDGTKTMIGEISWLQWYFGHIRLHTKWIHLLKWTTK